ncbi:MAG: hypothetical protein ACPKM0_12900 [Pleomorphochaeta sp.]
MKKTKLILLTLILSITLSSCASILSDSSYPVTISSSPTEANIVIRNSSNIVVYKGTTPALVKLDASNGFFKKENYTITFSKEGYEESIYTIENHLDGWYWGNILAGGLIGMLIIDPSTGAMWSLDTSIYYDLTEEKTSNNISIMNLDDIPNEWIPYLTKLV